jgi:hypothetical protein
MSYHIGTENCRYLEVSNQLPLWNECGDPAILRVFARVGVALIRFGGCGNDMYIKELNKTSVICVPRFASGFHA